MNDKPAVVEGLMINGPERQLAVFDGEFWRPAPKTEQKPVTEDFAKVVRGHDGHLYLTFNGSVDAEFFLEDLGVDPRTVPLYNCGGYENAIIINESRTQATPH